MQALQDTAELDNLIGRIGAERRHLIPLLLAVQDQYRCLPSVALQHLSARLGLSEAEVTGVASFYGQFRLRPTGQHRIRVCDGTACHVQRAPAIHEALLRHLRIEPPNDTDANGLFTVETVACLGCCTLAPVVQVDNTTYGHLSPDHVGAMLEAFLAEAAIRPTSSVEPTSLAVAQAREIRVGLGSCCVAKGSQALFSALHAAIQHAGGGIRLKRVGCIGTCYQAPVVEVLTPGQAPARYVGLLPQDVSAVVQRHFPAPGVGRRLQQWGNEWLDRLLTGHAHAIATCQRDPGACETADFLTPQVRLATSGAGALDPLDLQEYRAGGGFEALRQVCDARCPADVIAMITQSGLRGRGGAGFPTGRKWEIVRQAPGVVKYVVCNGDEGDPGAFMDRMILESHPYRVIEGLAIAAWAVGAQEAVFYIRHEYPLAVKRVCEALHRVQTAGVLNGLGPDSRPLRMRVAEGAGAFVCGEETALLASLEGRRGTPRLRPPYPGLRGLNDCPTLVNNVETLALVPWILAHGAEAFRQHGASGSSGTKVFALAGRVARGGLIEVPMGLSVRDIVTTIGSGAPEGRAFKAVQIGGPSGGCVPASLADTPVDYETLNGVGSMMGSGAWWFWTRPTAWWKLPAIFYLLPSASPAASARPVVSARAACSTFWIDCAQGRGGWRTWLRWSDSRGRCVAAASAAWGARRPTRYFPRCATSATNMMRMWPECARRASARR